MPNRRIITFLLALLTSLAAAAPLFSQDRIEWVAVEGADHYQVEIRQNDALVLETRSDEAWLPLFLPAGEYRFQVRVINTFGKVASESRWSALTIRAPEIPFIVSMTPNEIHEDGTRVFETRVTGFVPAGESGSGSTFRLENPEEKAIELEVTSHQNAIGGEDDSGAWTSLVLDSGRKNPERGSWTLVMTNPDGRSSRMDSALRVLDRLRPRIRSVSPDRMPAGETHNPLSITIAGLEEGASVEFSGPSDIRAALLARPDEGILEYSLNLMDAEPGQYSLRVVNPSGGEDEKPRAFEVLPRPLTQEEIAALHALKIDEKDPMKLPDYPRSLQFGLSASIPFGRTAGFYQTDFPGLSFGYTQAFHNDFFRKLYWLRGLAWDFTTIYSFHRTSYPITDIRLHRFQFLLGLNYVTPFDFPLNLLLRISSGIGTSSYSSPDHGPDEDLGGFTLRDLGSLDYVIRFGGGVRIDIGSRWYIDADCDVSAIMYLSRTVWTIHPRIEGGWRL